MRLTQMGNQQLQEAGFQPDYLAIADAISLRPAMKEDYPPRYTRRRVPRQHPFDR